MTVTVYTKPSCVQCNATYRALDNAGIHYDKIDLTQDQESFDKVVAMGYQQVPVVIAGDQHWSGYQPARISELFRG